MAIKNAYYYLFYTLYKVCLTGKIKELGDWYAATLVLGLELFFFISLYNYYNVFINRYSDLQLTSPKVYIPFAILLTVNYFSFTSNDKWKLYVAEFDSWSNEKNIKMGIITWIIITVIIVNLFPSFYAMSMVNWKLYNTIKT